MLYINWFHWLVMQVSVGQYDNLLIDCAALDIQIASYWGTMLKDVTTSLTMTHVAYLFIMLIISNE